MRAVLRLPAALLFVLAFAAFAAACGGSDSGDDDATPTAQTSPAASASRTAAPATPAGSPTAGADTTATSSVPVPPAPSREPPDAPPPAQPTTAPPPPTTAPPPPPAGASITISAFNATAFSPTSAAAPANAPVTLTFDNQDPGVLHDLTLYSPAGATLAETDVFAGVAQRTVTFTTGAPGSYPFICSVHPQDMRGTLVVQ